MQKWGYPGGKHDLSLKQVESVGPRNIQVCTDALTKERGGLGRWACGCGYQVEVLTRALGMGNKRGEQRGQTKQTMVVLSL